MAFFSRTGDWLARVTKRFDPIEYRTSIGELHHSGIIDWEVDSPQRTARNIHRQEERQRDAA